MKSQAREIDRRRLAEVELEASQQHLKQTVAQMQASLESERQRTRIEIHDELAPLITSLTTQLEWLAGHTSKASPAAQARLLEVRRTLLQLEEAAGPGGQAFAGTEKQRAPNEVPPAPTNLPHESLSDNEYAVMKGIMEGKSIKHISAVMGIRPSTASTYRARLLKKMHISSDAELIRYGIEHGLHP
jgi:DNA-binding CsgD family transcriptional regulator